MKILVVDDEIEIATGLVRALQQEGYLKVSAAFSSAEAKQAVFASGGLDLLITDVVMEGEDGFTLRETLLPIFPALKTIFLSEYDLSDYQDRMVGCPQLTKPVNPATVVQFVRLIAPPDGPPETSVPAAHESIPSQAPAEPKTPTPAPTPAVVAVPAAVAVPKPTPVAVPRPVAATSPPTVTPTPVAVSQETSPAEDHATETHAEYSEPSAPESGPTPTPTPTPTPVAVPRPVAAASTPTPAPVAVPHPVPLASSPPVAPSPVAVVEEQSPAVEQSPEAPASQSEPVVAQATPSPAATPAAVAVTAPVAVPTPSPVPVTVPRPAVNPSATPASASTPAPAAKVSASPAVKVPVGAKPGMASAPRSAAAKPSPKTPQAPAAKTTAAKDVELPPDSLVGTEFAGYQIEAKIAESKWGGVYRAQQSSMARKVRLTIMDQNKAADPALVQAFQQDATLKASVKHPLILDILEAGEHNGIPYLSSEYFPSVSLEQSISQGQTLSEKSAFAALKTLADTLGHLWSKQIPHELIRSKFLLQTGDTQFRLANAASQNPEKETSQDAEIKEVGAFLTASMDKNISGGVPGLRELLSQMALGDPTLPTWNALLPLIAKIQPRTQVSGQQHLDAKEIASRDAIRAAKERQRKSVLLTGLTSLSLLTIAMGFVFWLLFFKGGTYKDYSNMIEIPAGEFIFQDGQKETLPTFWIDEFPVTIGQYSAFLQWIEKNPDKVASIAHPNAPSGKTYIPQDWADMELNSGPMPGYYTRAKKWGKFRGGLLDLNSPVFGVDFYDAYAYAQWKGRRLPTEQEWEKAARGTQGFLYPWGNEPNDEWVNSGKDFNTDIEKGGEIDGWKRWSPVNAMKRDKSPFGVMSMAGGVSEWTNTWEESEFFGGMEVPVIKGGNWEVPEYILTRRVLRLMPEQNHVALGFRTASSTPPEETKK